MKFSKFRKRSSEEKIVELSSGGVNGGAGGSRVRKWRCKFSPLVWIDRTGGLPCEKGACCLVAAVVVAAADVSWSIGSSVPKLLMLLLLGGWKKGIFSSVEAQWGRGELDNVEEDSEEEGLEFLNEVTHEWLRRNANLTRTRKPSTARPVWMAQKVGWWAFKYSLKAHIGPAAELSWCMIGRIELCVSYDPAYPCNSHKDAGQALVWSDSFVGWSGYFLNLDTSCGAVFTGRAKLGQRRVNKKNATEGMARINAYASLTG